MSSSTPLAPVVDVLVVGAGPTGLTLACQLADSVSASASSTSSLIVPANRVRVDRDAPVAIELGAVPRADSRFPYILFVSQSDAETTRHCRSFVSPWFAQDKGQ
jgi:hypothetical protein